MAISRAFSILAAALVFTALGSADQFAINNPTVQIPVGPHTTASTKTDFSSPRVLLGGEDDNNPDIGLPGYDGDTIFLKFQSDYLGNLEAFNSISVTITFQDDEQDAGETARVDYALPNSNILLADSPFVKLGKNEDPNPDTLTFTLYADQLSADQKAQVLSGFADKNFRIRIMRETGDFLVTAASANVTYSATPEPATLLLLLPAVGLIGLRRRA
jgi:hypothetical protein